MKPGVKGLPADTKRARGTFQPVKDAGKVQICASDEPPQMPDYLGAGAEEVWIENISRVMASGVGELDSDEFASYCALEADCRSVFKSGETPPVSALVECRRKRELLGIAGPKSRIMQVDTADRNPFSRLKNRQK